VIYLRGIEYVTGINANYLVYSNNTRIWESSKSKMMTWAGLSEMRSVYKISVKEPERKKSFGRRKSRREDNMDWIHAGIRGGLL
jgi:hypothetical protein